MSSLLTLATALCFAPTLTSALVAYDCHSPNVNITTYSNVDVIPCQKPHVRATNTTTITQVLVLQRERFRQVPAIQCSLEIQQHIFHCGMNSHSTHVLNGIRTFKHPLTSAQCQELTTHNRLAYPFQPTTILTTIPDAANVGTVYVVGQSDPDGTCAPGHFVFEQINYKQVVVYHQYTLMYHTLTAKYEHKTQLIHFPDLTCPFRDDHCSDHAQGEFFWNSVQTSTCDAQNFRTLYTGRGDKLLLTDDNDHVYPVLTIRQDMFIFTLRLIGISAPCSDHLSITDHEDIFVITNHEARNMYLATGQPSVIENVSLLAYVNTKFMYVQNHMANQIETLYQDLMFQQCEHKRTTLIHQLTFAFSDPEQFAYALMQRPGYTALVAGELIHLIHCREVNVTYRPDQHCYLEIPVTYEDTPAFVTPRNRLVVKHATEVECNPLYPVAYNFSNVWTITTSNVHIMPSPNVLDPNLRQSWRFNYDFNLGQAGLYSTAQVEQLTRRMLLPTERTAINNVVASTLNDQRVNRQGLHFHNILDKESIQKSLSSYTDFLVDKLTNFGILCSTIIGIVTLIKWSITCIEIIINATHLYKAFGWSCKLFGALLHSATTYLLFIFRQESAADAKQEFPTKYTKKDNEIPLMPPRPQNMREASSPPLYPAIIEE